MISEKGILDFILSSSMAEQIFDMRMLDAATKKTVYARSNQAAAASN